MRRLTKRHGLHASVALAAVYAPTPSLAQNAGSAASSGDIIVTARRTEERLQDVPIAITVYNQDQLTKRNVTTADDLAKTTPGLEANTNFGAENSAFSLRGFTQDIGTQPTVGVYFADVVAPRGGSDGSFAGDGAGAGMLFDLQNVQVLKGPQGTLQGRNTTGGAIMLVPQKPTDRLEGYVEGGLGNYNQLGVQAVLNIPLNDTFKVRLGIDRQKRDGYLVNQTGIGPNNFNDLNYTAVRASIVANLTPNLENYIIASYSSSDTHGTATKLISTLDPAKAPGSFAGLAYPQLEAMSQLGYYDVFSQMPDAQDLKHTWQVIDTTTWQASDHLTVKNIVSYAELRQRNRQAIFDTNFYLGPNLPIYSSTLYNAPGLDNTAQATFTEELQFQGRGMDGKLRWQGGVYFEKATPLGYSGVETPSFANCPNLGQTSGILSCYGIPGFGGYDLLVAKTSYRDVAVYAQATYEVTQKLSLTAGFRYTWDKMTSNALEEYYRLPVTPGAPLDQFCIYNWSAAPAGGCPNELLSKSSRAPTWLIDLDYKPMQDVLLYAKYARGYRAGGVKNDAPDLGLLVPGAPDYRYFNPEKLDAFEVGLKSSFHGAISGTFNVAAFYNKFTNQQVQLGLGLAPYQDGSVHPNLPEANGPPTSAPENVGRSRIYGVDVDFSLNLFKGFELSGGYEYLNSKVTQLLPVPTTGFYNTQVTPQLLAVQGLPLDNTPKNKYMITGTYTLPLDASAGDLSVGLTFTHTDSRYSTFDDALFIELFGGQLVAKNGSIVSDNTDFGHLAATNLLDMNVSWKNVLGKPLDLTFWATNLTNQHYLTWVEGLLAYGFEVGNVGAPRMYGVKAKVHF